MAIKKGRSNVVLRQGVKLAGVPQTLRLIQLIRIVRSVCWKNRLKARTSPWILWRHGFARYAQDFCAVQPRIAAIETRKRRALQRQCRPQIRNEKSRSKCRLRGSGRNHYPNMRLQGKTALITGGNSGIGLVTARLFVAQGARVAITGRNKTTLHALSGVGACSNQVLALQPHPLICG